MTTNPTNVSEVSAKIDNGEVKVKATKAKANKAATLPTAKAPIRKAPSDEEFLEALKQIYRETKKATHSRALSDKLGIKNDDFGRGAARAAMRRLAAVHKVRIVTASEGKTKFSYTPLDA